MAIEDDVNVWDIEASDTDIRSGEIVDIYVKTSNLRQTDVVADLVVELNGEAVYTDNVIVPQSGKTFTIPLRVDSVGDNRVCAELLYVSDN